MYKINYFVLTLLVILFFIYIYFYQIIKKKYLIENYIQKNISYVSNPVEYSNLLYKNLESGKLTKLEIQEKDVRREDCDEKCGAK